MGISSTFPLWLAFLSLFATSCSTFTARDMAQKPDYERAVGFYNQALPHQALAVFPRKESGGFITSMEKAWLQLLAGKPDPTILRTIADELDQSRTMSVTREAKGFFYKESADGYFPGEHEVILLHLMLGTIYAKLNDTDKVRVEVTRASRYLQTRWEGGQPFDDPFLRIWAAALWMACDEWDHARIDLRVAIQLSPVLKDLSEIANRPTPPPSFQLIFAGPGPVIEWDHSPSALKEFVPVKFVGNSKTPQPVLTIAGNTIASGTPALSSLSWYDRHLLRNDSISDKIMKSKYMTNSVVGSVTAGGTYAIGSTGNFLLENLGIATGTLIIVGSIYGAGAMAVAAGSGVGTELLLLVPFSGVAAGVLLIEQSVNHFKSNQDRLTEKTSNLLDTMVNPARYYRYVRFLPEWLSVIPISKKDELPRGSLDQEKSSLEPFVTATSPNGTQVYFYSDLADRYFERVTKLAEVTWVDPSTQKTWRYFPEPTEFQNAASVCQKLGRFHLATVADISEARTHRLFAEHSPMVGDFTDDIEVWVTPGAKIDQGTCSYSTRLALRELVTVECSEQKMGLCLSD